MFNPPDELLADLQSALPPEPSPPPSASATSRSSTSSSVPNGHKSVSPHDHLEEHIYDRTQPLGYEWPDKGNGGVDRGSVASTAIVVRYAGDEGDIGKFDSAEYSEVRKGPFYTAQSSSLSPTQQEGGEGGGGGWGRNTPPMKPPRDGVSPLSPSTGSGGAGGLAELDNLLAMLTDTQVSDEDQSKPQAPEARPSMGNLVDELTEVEAQVGGGGPRKPPVEGGTKRANITASTATLELDELMANLSNFEPPPGVNATIEEGTSSLQQQQQQQPPKPKSAADDLDLMLGSLDHDMAKRHGINTTAKGMCAACNKPILAKVVDALGKQWHPEHFTCVSCDTELGHVTYYESNGRPYCEKDYHELYAPRCAYCNGPILERVMRALDKTWHPEHFFCTLCGKHFGPEGFHEKDSKAFCRECYYEKFAPRCRRCDKAIMEGFITALGAQWHPECFSCKVCQVTFPRGNYFDHEGEPHCEIHYHASRGTLCASCQKPVTGKCITAMGKKWHPEHFTCAFCLKLLNKGTFKEHRHNPYCQPCYIKLFG